MLPGSVGSVVNGIEYWAALLIGLAAVGVDVWALVDSLTRRSDAFPAVNRLTKVIWVVILAVASLVAAAVLTVGSLFLSLIALAAGMLYLLDTRPRIKEITGGGAGGRRQNQGPYGPW